jgi:hypothetical protein
MSNPYYDPELLDEWRERIVRLRTLSDMPAPWDVDPDVERWKRGLGTGPHSEDFLNSHMLDWQVWLRSLSGEQRAAYQARYPEPHGWGLYQLTFSRATSSEVSEDKGPEVYWDLLEKHYDRVFGVA